MSMLVMAAGIAAGAQVCRSVTRFLEEAELFVYEEDDE